MIATMDSMGATILRMCILQGSLIVYLKSIHQSILKVNWEMLQRKN